MKFSESVVERKNFWLLMLHLDFTDFFFSLLSFIFLLYILVLLPWRNLSIWFMTLMFNCARLAFSIPACAAPHQVWLAPRGTRGTWNRQEECLMALSNPAAQKLRKTERGMQQKPSGSGGWVVMENSRNHYLSVGTLCHACCGPVGKWNRLLFF